jgi:hypothetical protein
MPEGKMVWYKGHLGVRVHQGCVVDSVAVRDWAGGVWCGASDTAGCRTAGVDFSRVGAAEDICDIITLCRCDDAS